jgi:hypothetical protein
MRMLRFRQFFIVFQDLNHSTQKYDVQSNRKKCFVFQTIWP